MHWVSDKNLRPDYETSATNAQSENFNFSNAVPDSLGATRSQNNKSEKAIAGTKGKGIRYKKKTDNEDTFRTESDHKDSGSAMHIASSEVEDGMTAMSDSISDWAFEASLEIDQSPKTFSQRVSSPNTEVARSAIQKEPRDIPHLDPSQLNADQHTDSGYASMSNIYENKGFEEIDDDDDDIKTVNTDNEELTLSPSARDAFVSAFVDELYQNLQNTPYDKSSASQSIAGSLPGLLKSFSVQLRGKAMSKIERDTAVFLRHNRKYVPSSYL